MQASFSDLVGSADFVASATTLQSMERGELARELSGPDAGDRHCPYNSASGT